MTQEEIKELLTRHEQLRNAKAQVLSEWQDIAKYFRADRSNWNTNPGTRQADEVIYDSIGEQAVSMAADGFSGYMCNYAVQWVALASSDDIPPAQRDQANKIYQRWQDHLYRVFGRSNFYSQEHEATKDVWSLATMVMFIKDDPVTKVPSFHCVHPKQFYIAENAHKNVDEVHREFYLPAREVVKTWEEKMSQELKEEATRTPNANWKILHLVIPAWKEEKGTYYQATYLLEEKQIELSTAELDESPYVCWRFSTNSDEVYGRGPAHRTIAEVKLLNQINKTKLIHVQKAIDPPMWAPPEAQETLDMSPGAENFFPLPAGGAMPGPIGSGGQYPIVLNEIQHYRQIVMESFRTDFFRLLQQQTGARTATEVMELQGEKAAILATATSRMMSEFLTPLIDKVLKMEHEAGRLPMPDGIKLEKDVIAELIKSKKVEYVGMLPTLQRKYSTNQSYQVTLQMLGGLAGMFGPTVLDNVDSDKVAGDILRKNGVNADSIRSAEAIKNIRKNRAQAQAEQQKLAIGMEAMKAGALNQESSTSNLGNALNEGRARL
jgi:hypothetical protein